MLLQKQVKWIRHPFTYGADFNYTDDAKSPKPGGGT